MKKIALIVIVAALSILISTTLTSVQAQVEGGRYQMTSTGSCLHSTSGFNETAPPFTPKINANFKVWAATTMAKATWDFKIDGTGTASGKNYVIDFPPGGAMLKSSAVRENPINLKFSYEIVDSDIIITLLNASDQTIGELRGTVSNDENTLTIDSPYQVYNLGSSMGYAVCNTARILIRVGDICPLNFADCNNDMSDGCETNLLTDPYNCGGCGVTCASGQTCQNGKCMTAPPGQCSDNNQCEPNLFCQKPPGACDTIGICSPRPSVCPRTYEPVCGCDGRTYDNACLAAQSGVNVFQKGNCPN